MKTEYRPDNTRTSITVVLGLAAVVIVLALLFGLSDKPQVDQIGLSAGSSGAVASADLAAAQAGSIPSIGFGAAGDDDQSDQTSSVDSNALDQTASSDAVVFDEAGQPIAADDLTEQERVIIEVPTTEPTATPEVAPAVEPTAIPDQTAEAAAGEVQAAPSLPTTAGSVQGTFFTRSDENEGAVVAQNLITVSFAEDGSGAFQGVLDITYLDGTHILLNMSGPVTWAPTNPQVEASLAGAFTLDAPIDADDITTDDAELSISSFDAGSGSLCTTKCFGFTFPSQ